MSSSGEVSSSNGWKMMGLRGCEQAGIQQVTDYEIEEYRTQVDSLYWSVCRFARGMPRDLNPGFDV